MKLPPILSAAVLSKLAAPDETHAVRVMMLNTSSSTQFTLRGMGRRKGKYLLVRDGVSGRHTIDIPASLWNQDIPGGKYHDNTSIAHDLMSKPQILSPFVVALVPWNGGQAAAVKESLTTQEASPAITTATDLVDAVETISLRLLELVNPCIFEAFATPQIKAKLGGECGPTVTAFLEAAGRTEVVEFIQTITGEKPAEEEPSAPAADDSVTAPEGSGLETPPQASPAKSETSAAKRMREKRARDKAARQASKLQPA